jgi:tetratricopeptide (TPR) repeat protein
MSVTLHGQVTYSQFTQQSDLKVKSEMALELWNEYSRSDLDSLKVLAVDLLLLASEKKHGFARAVGRRILGSYLYRSGKVDQGLEFLMLARDYFEKKEDYTIASEIWNDIGHSFLLNGAYVKARKAYNKSLLFGEKSFDVTASFNAKLGLGRSYIMEGDTSTGMRLLHSYKQKSLEHDKYEAAADVFAYMAMIEQEMGNRLLSREYFDKSITYSKMSDSKVHLAHSYANLGIRHYNSGDYDSSLFYFEKSLELRLELKTTRPILEAYYNLGFFYLDRNDSDQALLHFETGRVLAEKHNYWVDVVDFLGELIPIYEERGKDDLVQRYSDRKAEVELLIKEKNAENNSILEGLDLEFKAKEEGQLGISDRGGVNWFYFSSILLGALIVLFVVVERYRKIN